MRTHTLITHIQTHIFLNCLCPQITQMERHMNVLVGYMLLWVLFASIMLGAGDQIFNRLHTDKWYLQLDGTWPELGQVGERVRAAIEWGAHVPGWPELYLYAVYIRYFWQGNHQIYGNTRCIYTVLANPAHVHAGADAVFCVVVCSIVVYVFCRVGQNHIYIYKVCTIFLAWKSPYIRSYTVHIYGSGQPCTCAC